VDLRYGREHEDFRERVREFLGHNWPLRGEGARLSLGEQAALFRERAADLVVGSEFDGEGR
jgi:hypothetical protein